MKLAFDIISDKVPISLLIEIWPLSASIASQALEMRNNCWSGNHRQQRVLHESFMDLHTTILNFANLMPNSQACAFSNG